MLSNGKLSLQKLSRKKGQVTESVEIDTSDSLLIEFEKDNRRYRISFIDLGINIMTDMELKIHPRASNSIDIIQERESR